MILIADIIFPHAGCENASQNLSKIRLANPVPLFGRWFSYAQVRINYSVSLWLEACLV